MLSENVSLKNILTSLEAVLEIDYTDDCVRDILDKAVTRLESSYNVELSGNLFDTLAANKLISDQLSVFVGKMVQCLKDLTYYTLLAVYNKSIPFSLADVNYFGDSRPTVTTALKYLQDAESCKAHSEVILWLTSALDQIQICQIKRLATCMLMLSRLGVDEGVGLCANLLYLGGLCI